MTQVNTVDNYVIVARAVRLHFSATWKVVIASAAAVFPVPDAPTTIFEAYQQPDCCGRWPTTMLSCKRLHVATALGSIDRSPPPRMIRIASSNL